MLAISERSRRETDDCEALNVPYSPQLRKFFTLSRKYQTLHSDFEGKQSNTTFEFHEEEAIEHLITWTMFSKKSTEGTIRLDEEEKRVIKNITGRMIEESRKYNCKVHFGVIWVYYFTYRDEKLESLPVFKIYKYQSGVIFLDAFSKVYKTWDNFIDNVALGESLLCVPRNGEYNCDEGVLNLEYVLSKNVRRAAEANLWLRSVSSISQIHCSWLEKLESWLLEHPKIREVVDRFLSFVKDKLHIILAIALGVIVAFFELGHDELLVIFCQQAIRIALKYANLRGCERFQSFLSESEKAVTTYSKVCPELKTLFSLMRKEKKDCFEIFNTLSNLVKTSKAVGDSRMVSLPHRKQNSLSSHIGVQRPSLGSP